MNYALDAHDAEIMILLDMTDDERNRIIDMLDALPDTETPRETAYQQITAQFGYSNTRAIEILTELSETNKIRLVADGASDYDGGPVRRMKGRYRKAEPEG